MNSTQNNDLPLTVVICGPTGVGKTSLAIDLARRFEGEIIGADSMQLYRHMDIGTAKPTPGEQAAVTHHMVDIVDPDDHFDAEMYAGMAYTTVLTLTGKGILPFIVGGTGLYIKALIHGLFESLKIDTGIRKRLKKEAEARGGPHLHARLKTVDPAAAARIHANDTYRIVRALEIYETTGRRMSDTQQLHQFKPQRLQAIKIGLHMEREELYQRIDQRVDQMISGGLASEVQGLVADGYGFDLPAMSGVGYGQFAPYLSGEATLDEVADDVKRATRRFVRQQANWFRQDDDRIHWFEVRPDTYPAILDLIRNFVTPLRPA